MKYIKPILVTLLIAFMVALPFAGVSDASAVNIVDNSCQGAGAGSPLCDSSDEELEPLIKNVVNLLLAVLGFVAVIMIIIGGIRYTTSNGDSNNTKAAKDTILYSVVGLVVAILAYAIVNFVLEFFA